MSSSDDDTKGYARVVSCWTRFCHKGCYIGLCHHEDGEQLLYTVRSYCLYQRRELGEIIGLYRNTAGVMEGVKVTVGYVMCWIIRMGIWTHVCNIGWNHVHNGGIIMVKNDVVVKIDFFTVGFRNKNNIN